MDMIRGVARFKHPQGLVFNGSSKLFVADTENETIRQIDLGAGTTSTLAGAAGMPGTANGGGSNARFWEPMGLTWDGANLYVADSVNDTLREIDVASTSVTTVAGTAGAAGSSDGVDGASSFRSPVAVTPTR
ncbi:MAG TPA: hypothetical protein VF515_22360 [Candidatus Binatia bacterium]